ncbi:MAG: hypothetical protein UT65_C0012G0008 [Parcubacteria group bacterium GW2011_GWF2_39_8b]|nr:MAG: hypothetical protein UT65_C0012G0008 [Parcubacteria group bacterium GW2011_GWF2_39_8b]KKR46159.1 MAG: hypothetical protein UT81_C0001G0006 [Parcubacteria group bacterium GW2011_GWA2_40_14]
MQIGKETGDLYENYKTISNRFDTVSNCLLGDTTTINTIQ